MKKESAGGCPFSSDWGSPNVSKVGDLTYNDYLKIPDLLKLQIPQSSPPHHDELLFIIIHQAYELWFKLILHELDNTVSYMQKNEILRAQHFVKRVVEIMKLLVSQIHILETMTPIEFLEFRNHLMPASGFQSLQFREIEFLLGLKDERYFHFFKNSPEILQKLTERLNKPDLYSVYFQMLRNLGYSVPSDPQNEKNNTKTLQALLPIYQNPEKNLPLYLLTESLVELDETLALWREHHVRVVERIIGFKKGTGGSSGVEYLKSTTSKKCFPALLEVRTILEKPEKKE